MSLVTGKVSQRSIRFEASNNVIPLGFTYPNEFSCSYGLLRRSLVSYESSHFSHV